MVGRRWIGPWLVVSAIALVLACSPSPSETSSTATPEAADELPPVAVLISHRVTDYESWKAAFDARSQARSDASCLGHYLKQGIDEPDTIYVYCLATDPDRLRAFLESDDLANAMRDAGVVSEPVFTVMRPMSRDLIPRERLPGIIVMHEVKDYDAWRAVYDAFDPYRRENGIVGHAVGREIDNPNRLVVYHQARDVDALRAFVASTELKETMQRAGVVGDPDIRFIQVVDFASY